VTYAALSLAVLLVAAAGAALYYRAESRRYRERADRAAQLVATLEQMRDAEVDVHADEVARLEAVVVEMRAEIKERDNEIETLLADSPGAAGRALRRELSAVPAGDPGGGDAGVPASPAARGPGDPGGPARGPG
jgi:hypothetical protein